MKFGIKISIDTDKVASYVLHVAQHGRASDNSPIGVSSSVVKLLCGKWGILPLMIADVSLGKQ